MSGTITDVQDDTAVQGKGHGIWIRISDKGQVMTMAVMPVTRVTILAAADASILKPGMRVRGVSQQAVDGTEIVQTLTAVTTRSGNRKAD